MPLSHETVTKIQGVLDGITSDKEAGAPGLVFVAVDKNGDTLTTQVSGTVGSNTDSLMSSDTIFWLASCTKLITAVACMQLVEAGKIDLDDSEALYELVPELKAMKMISREPDGPRKKILVEKPNEITLRMLLTHTAGFGYSCFQPELYEFAMPIGIDELSGDANDILKSPLIHPPGSRWEYSVGIDWAGVVVERISGLKLNAYFLKHIFEPLGLRNLSMFPSSEMKANLARLHQRWPGSEKIHECQHQYRRALIAETDEEQFEVFHSGGAGCFAKPTEYCQILATILNNGTHPKTSHQLLSPASIATLLSNQIPHMPDFGRVGIPTTKPDITNALPQLLPQTGDPPQGWSFAGFKQLESFDLTGRPAGSVSWAGIANCFWWLDPENGVAGMIASQVLPFADAGVMGAWFQCEALLYKDLGSK